MNTIIHQLADFLRLLGLRDRLRCPSCSTVGTYKPHGGWLDRLDTRRIRRWLCKWCGYYRGPEGDGRLCYPSKEFGCWGFIKDGPDVWKETPEQWRRDLMPRVWPWLG